MRDTERSLADFYQQHPYLIAKEFGDKFCVAEQVKGRHRLDLLVKLAAGAHSIVEFKREPLLADDVLQLTRYWRAWRRTHRMAAKHYLVGLRPRNEEALAAAMAKAPMKVIARIIPEDVPSVVRWSDDQRRYVRYQEGDKEMPIELRISR